MPGAERSGADRRRTSGEFRVAPRDSPAALLVLTVSAVLVAVAAAAALLERGPGATPHGRLLATLEKVAEAQEEHYHEAGRFTAVSDRLPLTDSGLEVIRLRVVGDRWEAALRDPQVGLTCSQAGGSQDGQVIRHRPACYTVQ